MTVPIAVESESSGGALSWGSPSSFFFFLFWSTAYVKAIIFLSDGHTWTEISGSSICIVKDDDVILLRDGLISPQSLEPIFEIGLSNETPIR